MNYLQEILSEQEETHIKQFVDNVGMREAVRKVLLAGLYENGVIRKGQGHDPVKNFTFGFVQDETGKSINNEAIGERLRAAFEGVMIVEASFSNMNTYRTETQRSKPNINEAR